MNEGMGREGRQEGVTGLIGNADGASVGERPN